MNDQQVARLRQRFYLAREHVLEPEIVSSRGEQGCVGRQGDRRIRTTVSHIADDVFRGHMLGVGGAATVAAKEECSTSAHCVFNESERDIELRSELGGDTI